MTPSGTPAAKLLAALEDHPRKGTPHVEQLKRALGEASAGTKGKLGDTAEGLYAVFKSLKRDLVGRSRESWDLPLALDLLRVPRGEFRRGFLENFKADNGGDVVSTIHAVFKTFSEYCLDTVRDRPLESIELDILAELNHLARRACLTNNDREILASFGAFLPELLDFILSDRAPFLARRDVAETLEAIIKPRNGTATRNVKAFAKILRSDEYGVGDDAAKGPASGSASSLVAFCRVFDGCGDYPTQRHLARALLVALTHGGLTRASLERPLYGPMNMTELDGLATRIKSAKDGVKEDSAETWDLLSGWVSAFNASRGGSASTKTIISRRFVIGGVVADASQPFVEFGRHGISFQHKFPDDEEHVFVTLSYDKCVRRLTRRGDVLGVGLRARPHGFGAGDAWSGEDDHWASFEFGPNEWAQVEARLHSDARPWAHLKADLASFAPRRPDSKCSRGVSVSVSQISDHPRLPPVRTSIRMEDPTLTFKTDLTSPRDTVEELPYNLPAKIRASPPGGRPSGTPGRAGEKEPPSQSLKKHLDVDYPLSEDSGSESEKSPEPSPKRSEGKTADETAAKAAAAERDSDSDFAEDGADSESDAEIGLPKTRGNGRVTRAAAAKAAKAIAATAKSNLPPPPKAQAQAQAPAPGKKAPTRGSKKATDRGAKEKARASPEKEKPPEKPSSRPNARGLRGKKTKADSTANADRATLEPPAAPTGPSAFDVFLADNARAKGETVPPSREPSPGPEQWWSPRARDLPKSRPFARDSATPKRAVRRNKSRTPEPAHEPEPEREQTPDLAPLPDSEPEPEPERATKKPVESAKVVAQHECDPDERARRTRGSRAPAPAPASDLPKLGGKKSVLRRRKIAAAEPKEEKEEAPPPPPDTAFKTAAVPSKTPLGSRMVTGEGRRKPSAGSSRKRGGKQDDATPPLITPEAPEKGKAIAKKVEAQEAREEEAEEEARARARRNERAANFREAERWTFADMPELQEKSDGARSAGERKKWETVIDILESRQERAREERKARAVEPEPEEPAPEPEPEPEPEMPAPPKRKRGASSGFATADAPGRTQKRQRAANAPAVSAPARHDSMPPPPPRVKSRGGAADPSFDFLEDFSRSTPSDDVDTDDEEDDEDTLLADLEDGPSKRRRAAPRSHAPRAVSPPPAAPTGADGEMEFLVSHLAKMKEEKSRIAEEKISAVVKKLRAETAAAAKALNTEVERERDQVERHVFAAAKSQREKLERLVEELRAESERFRGEVKRIAREFAAAEAEIERGKEETAEKVAAARATLARRAKDVKSCAAKKGEVASHKIAKLRRDAREGCDLGSMLRRLADSFGQ